MAGLTVCYCESFRLHGRCRFESGVTDAGQKGSSVKGVIVSFGERWDTRAEAVAALKTPVLRATRYEGQACW